MTFAHLETIRSEMPQQQRINLLIDHLATMQRLSIATGKRIDRQIQIEEKNNPIDQRLRAICGKDDGQITAHGMAGAGQIFASMLDPDRYKKAAANHLLRLRHTRRWHLAHRGNIIGQETYTKLLSAAAFCRRRAAGIEPMPQVMAVNL